MAFDLLDGIVSNIQRGSTTETIGNVTTNQLLSMRINGRPATLKSQRLFDVKEGERIIAAGPNHQGTVTILAIRNLSTGAQYHPSVTANRIMASVLIFFGILPLPLFPIGCAAFPLAVFGMLWLCLTFRGTRCIAMVDEATRRANVPTRSADAEQNQSHCVSPPSPSRTDSGKGG